MAGVELSRSRSETDGVFMKPSRRILTSRGPQNYSQIASKSLPTEKKRYEMTLEASIYRYLSIRRPLAKLDFSHLSSPLFIIHVNSWFRIVICCTNSPSAVFISMSRVLCNLFIFKVNKVDFVCIFIDRSGPRFGHTSTMYRKYRIQKQVAEPIYRYLSIGMALRNPHFHSPCWFFFLLPFWLKVLCVSLCLSLFVYYAGIDGVCWDWRGMLGLTGYVAIERVC